MSAMKIVAILLILAGWSCRGIATRKRPGSRAGVRNERGARSADMTSADMRSADMTSAGTTNDRADRTPASDSGREERAP